jgi:hypothetical protein
MPSGPYSGLGYQLSSLGSNVPSGYLRGQEAGQQMQMQQAQQAAMQQELAQKQALAQRGFQEFEGMRQAGISATDEAGSLDPNKYLAGLARSGVNVSNPLSNYVAKQAAAEVRANAVKTTQGKALQAVGAQEAYALSKMPDADRDDYFDNHTTHILKGLGASDEEIESQRPLIHNDAQLGAMGKSYAGAAKLETQGQQKMDIAKLNGEVRLTASRMASATQLAKTKMGFTDKPLSNPEAQYYRDLKEQGASPEDAMQGLIDARSILIDAKKKNQDPVTAASNAVAKIESTWGAKSEEKRDALFGSYVRLFSQAEPPKTPARLARPASAQPPTKVNPDNKKTYYLWTSDGRYHSTQPGK